MLFTAEEYTSRLEAVRDKMAQHGHSALIVIDPANMYYLTGYNAWSFYTPQLLFVPAAGDMILYTRQMDADGAWRTSWLPEAGIVGYPDYYVHRPDAHPFDWVSADLRGRGLVGPAVGGTVALEMDAHFFSAKAYRSLLAGLPEWTLVDSVELVNWVRVIKSPAEIDLMRLASTVTYSAMTRARDTIEDGARQCDVAAAILGAQASGTSEVPGDYPAIMPLLPTGDGADTPHLTWSGERIRLGEPVVVELAGVHHRYHVPMARTFVVGRGPDPVRRLAEAVDVSLQAVLDTVAAGVPVTELARVWNQSLRSYGYDKPSRMGYSIGIGYPPDWGERTISLRSEETAVLAENMTLHLMCGVWLDGAGYEVSEPIRVSATGVELFSSFERGLVRTGANQHIQTEVNQQLTITQPYERTVEV